MTGCDSASSLSPPNKLGMIIAPIPATASNPPIKGSAIPPSVANKPSPSSSPPAPATFFNKSSSSSPSPSPSSSSSSSLSSSSPSPPPLSPLSSSPPSGVLVWSVFLGAGLGSVEGAGGGGIA